MAPKFRAWDKAEKMMYLVASIDFVLEKIELWKGTIRSKYGIASSIQDSTDVELMQSTGLKDKNGVEVFEGDVLNIVEVTNQGLKEYLTDVKWEDCSFVVKSGGDGYDTFLAAWTGDPNTTYPLFEMQVVGNIYENPELLEQDNEQ
jgi:uncharacterized phage protein (TIGR01671 family)